MSSQRTAWSRSPRRPAWRWLWPAAGPRCHGGRRWLAARRDTDDVFGDVDHDKVARIVAAQLGYVAQHRAGDVAVWGVDDAERNGNVPLGPFGLQLMCLLEITGDRQCCQGIGAG